MCVSRRLPLELSPNRRTSGRKAAGSCAVPPRSRYRLGPHRAGDERLFGARKNRFVAKFRGAASCFSAQASEPRAFGPRSLGGGCWIGSGVPFWRDRRGAPSGHPRCVFATLHNVSTLWDTRSQRRPLNAGNAARLWPRLSSRFARRRPCRYYSPVSPSAFASVKVLRATALRRRIARGVITEFAPVFHQRLLAAPLP
ncbi:MAG: hypothetical protein JWL71_112 [Acidobacteria bacterium]|nr:hypothetical protein [Acidobacteriota bacterium]